MYPLPDDARLFPHGRLPARAGAALVAALAAIALAVPMLAEAGPGLSPTASANGCRAVGKQAQCSIALSFNPVEGASYYTATLVTPRGAVIPYGHVDPGSTSISFAYAGDGAYTVAITAYGTTEAAEPAEVANEAAEAEVAGAEGDAQAP